MLPGSAKVVPLDLSKDHDTTISPPGGKHPYRGSLLCIEGGDWGKGAALPPAYP